GLRLGGTARPPVRGEAVGDRQAQTLMPLIEITEGKDLPDNGLFPAAVEVWLTDGRHARVRCDIPPGAPANPMSDAEIDQKYLNCAGVVLDPAATERTRVLIQDIDRLADVGELCSALEGGSRP